MKPILDLIFNFKITWMVIIAIILTFILTSFFYVKSARINSSKNILNSQIIYDAGTEAGKASDEQFWIEIKDYDVTNKEFNLELGYANSRKCATNARFGVVTTFLDVIGYSRMRRINKLLDEVYPSLFLEREFYDQKNEIKPCKNNGIRLDQSLKATPTFPNYMFFPFDNLNVTFQLESNYVNFIKNNSITVYYLGKDENWKINDLIVKRNVLNNREFTIIDVSLSRNMFEVLRVSLLSLSIIIFTLSICFIHDLGGSLQISSGILIGMFSIQGIIFTKNTPENTIVELLYSYIYFILPVCVIFGSFSVKNNKNAEQSENFPEINFEWPI